MKKLILVLVVAGIAASASAEGPDITITGRLEGNCNAAVGSAPDWSFGMSSLYGLVEGKFGGHFSYLASLHLLSTAPRELYCNEKPLVYGSWLNTAYLSFDTEKIGIDAGKLFYTAGTFEMDEYDVYSYIPIVSDFWMSLTTYQYGLAFRFKPSEDHVLKAQVTTSPYMTELSTGNLAYGLSWTGQMGRFSTIWAVGTQRGPELNDEGEILPGTKVYYMTYGLGNRLTFDNFQYTLELTNYAVRQAADLKNTLVKFDFACIADDSIRPVVTVSMERLRDLKYGFRLEWFPLKDDAMRVFVAASNRHFSESLPEEPSHIFSACAGLTYDLRLSFK